MKQRLALLFLLLLSCVFVLPAKAAVSIIRQPQPVTVIAGDVAVFTVSATGTGTLTYQWKKSGNPISGATSAALAINPVSASDAATYTVDVTDATPSTLTSNAAALTIRTPGVGDVDFSFGGGASINNAVNAAALQSDGKVIIGGGFTAVASAVRGRIARLNADGSTDYTFGNGLAGADGTVSALAVQSDGKVLVGGFFATVNGTARSRIARLNSDGTLDTSFGNGLAGAGGTSPAVLALAVQSDGKVVIGGTFTTVNGVTRTRIARLNGDGTLDTAFGNGLAGASSDVDAVVLQTDGKVLIGGFFATVNGTIRGGIARLNSDGTLDTTFGSTVTGNGSVYAIALQSDGKVVIGGGFTSFNGTSRPAGIARLNSDGTLDTGFANGLTSNNPTVRAVALQGDGKVLLGGILVTTNGVAQTRFARLTTAGAADASFAATSTPNGNVSAILVQGDGNILVGGGFTSINGISSNRIARLTTGGTTDGTFANAITGISGIVYALAMQSDGKVLVGGDFTSIAGTRRNRIARLNSDGTLDTTFGNAQLGADGTIFAIAVQSDGKVLIGGGFLTVNGAGPHSIVARLNSDGTLDATFGGSSLIGVGGPGARALAVQTDGKVIVGGFFFKSGSINNLIRLNSDGSLDAAFGTTSGASSTVNALALQTDGKVIVGGAFTTINGTAFSRIARLTATGALDATFGTAAGATSTVSALAVQSDGSVLAGGDFTSINGTAVNRIARLTTTGAVDASFASGLAGASGTVSALALQSDGQVMIAGSFTTIHGTVRGGIARLTPTGTLDFSFANGLTGADASVNAIALRSDGKVISGGAFAVMNGSPRSSLARLIGFASSADLATLALSSGTLSPTFSAATTSYTASVSNTTGAITFTPTLSSTLASVTVNGGSAATPVTLTVGSGNAVSITVTAQDGTMKTYTVTVTRRTVFQDWALANGVSSDPNAAGANGLSNLQNFGFGVNPNSGAAGPLAFNGTFGAGGTIGANGQPITRLEPVVNGVDFRVLYVRRKDCVNAGLAYAVEFSPANLAPWTASGAVPTVLADDGAYQVVSVPFTPFIGGKKARFFHVRMTLAP